MSRNETDQRWPGAKGRHHQIAGVITRRFERLPSRGIPASLSLRAARELGPTHETTGRTPRTTVYRLPRDTRRESERSNGRRPRPASHRNRKVPSRALVPTPRLERGRSMYGVFPLRTTRRGGVWSRSLERGTAYRKMVPAPRAKRASTPARVAKMTDRKSVV